MKIFPLLLDSRPAYLECEVDPPPLGHHSILQMPVGPETLLGYLCRRLSRVSPHAPAILTTFEAKPGYEEALRRSGGRFRGVFPARSVGEHLSSYEPSDWLLIVDPRCFPAQGFDPQLLVGRRGVDPRGVTHLLALDSSSAGTQEYVQYGADGRVRRIQRYYEPFTWPFASKVSATLLPVACTVLLKQTSFESLAQLRQALTVSGVPSRDVAPPMRNFDLTDERGLLGLSEHFTLDTTRAAPDRQRPPAKDGTYAGSVHPSARLVGPVVIHRGSVICEEVTIIGPAVVGARVWVGPGATLAQCLVAPGAMVPEQALIQHRVWLGHPSPRPGTGRRRGVSRFEPGSSSGPGPLVLGDSPRGSGFYSSFKLPFDVAVAALLLVLLSPLLLVLALLVKLTSNGPVLYGDLREGRGGRPFRCWKLRTMRLGADALQRELYAKNDLDGPQFKLSDDPRVTPLGRRLRRTNLDEIPQLINVLCGQMSLVGPRPSPFRENQVCVQWRETRLSVRPGITGLWQLCRDDRDSGDFHQWIHYDVLYVQHLSLSTDLRILLATLLTLGGRWRVPPSRLISETRGRE